MEQPDIKRKSIGNRLTYAYIRKIKKWMFCPACQHGKMTIDKESTMWTCEDCGYKLSADEFEDDYVFWFCDECNAYLNNQEGFDRQAPKHICRNCGYKNDTTLENIRGICSDCGKVIPDADATLCVDCKKIRKQKAKEWLITASKVVGIVAAVAGTVYLASQATDDEDNADYTSLPSGDDDESSATMKSDHADDWRHNNADNIPEAQFCVDCIYHEVYVVRGYTHEHCVIWGLDGCHNGCDRKKTEPEYRWTDANRWDKD